MQTTLNIDRLAQALSEILSDKHGLSVSVEAIPRDTGKERQEGDSEAIA